MAPNPSSRETELAHEQLEELKHEFRKMRRNRLVGIAASLALAAVLFFPIGLPMLSFCCALIAAIFALSYFNVNGQLHDVNLRSTKTLFPRLSLLKQSSSAQQKADPATGK